MDRDKTASITHHVTSPDVGVVRKLVDQGVVVGGEERATAKGAGQLTHHRVRNGCSIVRRRSTT